DNLLSCFAGMQALLTTDSDETALLVCTDHEEVGSSSTCGADGAMLEQIVQRLLPSSEDYVRTIQKSLMISADNAHGI
ncbi:aminopeptidase 2, partial [Pseudomonas syringae pv. actinidiae ICMP 18804]